MQIILLLYYCIVLNEIRSYSPLLYYDYWPVSEFRGHDMKVLSRKNKTPSFEVLEYKKTCVPSLCGQKGGHKTLRFYRAYIMSYYLTR